MKTEILQRPRQFTSTFKNVMAFAGSEDNKLPSIGVKGPIQPRFESRQEYPSEVEIEIPDETKVSLKVKDQIQKNIILMIILILISVPLLDSQTWFLPLNVYQKSIEQLIYIKKNYPPAYDVEAKEYIGAMLNMTNPLVSFTITVNNSCCTFPDNYPQFLSQINNPLSNLRVQDMDIYQSDDYNVVFDMTSSNTFASLLNIGRTFFVCVLLLITSMLFSNDIESTALEPLQEMFDTVRKIAINPLNALREIEQKNMCLQALEKD